MTCKTKTQNTQVDYIWIVWASLLLIVIATEACTFQTIHDNRDPRKSVVTRSLSPFWSQTSDSKEVEKWQK